MSFGAFGRPLKENDMALKEHPEICTGCAQWVDVVNKRFVPHEVPWGPRNAHQRREWKRHGKPLCKGTGEIGTRAPTVWVEA